MFQTLNKYIASKLTKGGEGSGNHGHKGVPGEHGGSAGVGGSANTPYKGPPNAETKRMRDEMYQDALYNEYGGQTLRPSKANAKYVSRLNDKGKAEFARVGSELADRGKKLSTVLTRLGSKTISDKRENKLMREERKLSIEMDRLAVQAVRLHRNPEYRKGAMFQSLNKFISSKLRKGGAGSGNHGHKGRKGEHGGSVGDGKTDSGAKGEATGSGGSSSSKGPGLSLEQGFRVRDRLTAQLKESDFKVKGGVALLGQSSGVYVAEMPDGSKAIWKEQQGMKPRYMAEHMVRREPAAYEVDRMLGVNMTPPTVTREHNGQTGYLQGFGGKLDPRTMAKGGTSKDKILGQVSDDEIAKAAMFDYVINQRDRYAGNFRVTPRGDKMKLRLIDNSTAFGHEKDKLQAFTFLHEAVKRGVDIPPSTRERIKAITPTMWNQRLKSTLNATERKESYERLQNIVNGKSLKDAILKKPVPNFKFKKGYK